MSDAEPRGLAQRDGNGSIAPAIRVAGYIGVAHLGVHKHLARAHLAKNVSSLIFNYAYRGLLISEGDIAHHRFPMGMRQILGLGAMLCDFE